MNQGLYMLNIRHGDDCGFWRNDDIDECNCNPEIEQVAITDENMEEVVTEYEEGERGAQRLREIARRRN